MSGTFEEGYKEFPLKKVQSKMFKANTTAKQKQMMQQKYEYTDEHPGWGEGGKPREDAAGESAETRKANYKKRREDKEKENRAGKGTHQKVVPGVTGGKADELEDTFKKKSKGHSKMEEERMNFTEFLESATRPLYEKEGEVPKCPPGYKYDVEMKMCVPKSKKDSIGDGQKSGNKDMKPGNGAGYNVWGNSGYSGAGFAWEEQPTSHDQAGSGE